MADIDKLSWYYRKQSILLIAGLTLIAFIGMKVWFQNDSLTPLIVSTVFSLIVENIDIMIWARIAKRSPENLPTFFMGVSGFRMLLGIGVMFVYYLVADRNTMFLFFLIFAMFYVVLLVHHTTFFACERK
ncbi:hypothetical protein J5A66_06020 [Prevotella sp. oral taxon 475]|uniref:hypothetical protein n=1 Tax=Prevotella sp. oral taxon 475 TaxID=712471 RepID=UPI001BAB8D89|nr:hypothetical protein [Prevotella sp. oral taxon 475]QUB46553.1 hypothetical protein J5A66_06020 [Prevotella sp. oral taxon 475]